MDGLAEGSRAGRRPAVWTARTKQAAWRWWARSPARGVEGQLAEAQARRGSQASRPLADGEARGGPGRRGAAATVSTAPAATRSSKDDDGHPARPGSALSSRLSRPEARRRPASRARRSRKSVWRRLVRLRSGGSPPRQRGRARPEDAPGRSGQGRRPLQGNEPLERVRLQVVVTRTEVPAVPCAMPGERKRLRPKTVELSPGSTHLETRNTDGSLMRRTQRLSELGSA